MNSWFLNSKFPHIWIVYNFDICNYKYFSYLCHQILLSIKFILMLKHKDWVEIIKNAYRELSPWWIQSVLLCLLCLFLRCFFNLSWLIKLDKQKLHQLWIVVLWLLTSSLLLARKSQISHLIFRSNSVFSTCVGLMFGYF